MLASGEGNYSPQAGMSSITECETLVTDTNNVTGPVSVALQYLRHGEFRDLRMFSLCDFWPRMKECKGFSLCII